MFDALCNDEHDGADDDLMMMGTRMIGILVTVIMTMLMMITICVQAPG